jgi:hypothetical protein
MPRILSIVFALVVSYPATGLAQTPSAAAPLVVERVHTPFVVAPDYKVTDFDGGVGQLAGGYAGRVIDDALFVGGAGYWLVNGSRAEKLAYGGLVVGWSKPWWSSVRVGARGLVGAGTASLTREVTLLRGVRTRTASPAAVRVRDDFFVFEPQLNATIGLLPHVGVNLAGGYRLAAFTDALEDHLNGATGNLALQLEW